MFWARREPQVKLGWTEGRNIRLEQHRSATEYSPLANSCGGLYQSHLAAILIGAVVSRSWRGLRHAGPSSRHLHTSKIKSAIGYITKERTPQVWRVAPISKRARGVGHITARL
jgi:hypothetical protein